MQCSAEISRKSFVAEKLYLSMMGLIDHLRTQHSEQHTEFNYPNVFGFGFQVN